MKIHSLLFIRLILLLCLGGCHSGSPDISRATVYLADKFGGHRVSVYADDELFFSGRVLTDETSQLAAIIKIRPSSSVFKLRIQLDSPATGPLSIEQDVDYAKGAFFTVFLAGEKLHIHQEQYQPEFY